MFREGPRRLKFIDRFRTCLTKIKRVPNKKVLIASLPIVTKLDELEFKLRNFMN